MKHIKWLPLLWALCTIAAILAVAVWCGAPQPAAPAPAPTRAWLDGIQPCDQEDGSGESQTYPCVWDSVTRGNGEYAPGLAFVIYVRGTDAPCPTAAMVARTGGVCFDVDAFSRTAAEPGDAVRY